MQRAWQLDPSGPRYSSLDISSAGDSVSPLLSKRPLGRFEARAEDLVSFLSSRILGRFNPLAPALVLPSIPGVGLAASRILAKFSSVY
jgi:hypothetical protein